MGHVLFFFIVSFFFYSASCEVFTVCWTGNYAFYFKTRKILYEYGEDDTLEHKTPQFTVYHCKPTQ